MDYSIESATLDKLQSDCLIVGLYENQPLAGVSAELDALSKGLVTQLLARGDIKGKIAETLLINHTGLPAILRIVLVGLGEKTKLSRKQYRKALAATAKLVRINRYGMAYPASG